LLKELFRSDFASRHFDFLDKSVTRITVDNDQFLHKSGDLWLL